MDGERHAHAHMPIHGDAFSQRVDQTQPTPSASREHVGSPREQNAKRAEMGWVDADRRGWVSLFRPTVPNGRLADVHTFCVVVVVGVRFFGTCTLRACVKHRFDVVACVDRDASRMPYVYVQRVPINATI